MGLYLQWQKLYTFLWWSHLFADNLFFAFYDMEDFVYKRLDEETVEELSESNAIDLCHRMRNIMVFDGCYRKSTD